MNAYYRPLVQSGALRPVTAQPLAGGALWFTHAERLSRSGEGAIVAAQDIPEADLDRLTRPRPPIAGVHMDAPVIMGILNITPDSFSDGGRHATVETALAGARDMLAQDVPILDVGGESTRPGSDAVDVETEIARTAPVIAAIRAETGALISIDTRKVAVAEAALQAGAGLVNDVSGFTHDPDLAPLCARTGVPVCIMHARGDPKTMQDNPIYEHVLLDVYDFLAGQIALLEAAGVPRARIIADPGIGFGKTLEHNLALLKGISLFHGLGCPVLLGASRKRFIGTLGRAAQAADRAPGSIAVALAAAAQGVQILRVHDVAETAQALRLWAAVR
ncbi:dihydropteroate synthase [Cribrihabitans marinus]|uniref:Dihydropteroate synthase n=1 Tax=Cribrihabitans marinus TaxID=1227549 RepID=A0A1H6TNQ1_9RHOB|nr:dihydropteroate synthase [Cribrihabitans marinus]GGH21968.1 dihydropteroate synthase [Cribrihabitans marinus]SEI77880.1 dihydropteroate synthase [Cribrihabitans marinus]